MGTLSGGGTQVVSIGERCLLGANAGIGSRSATTASSRPAATSPPAPRSPLLDSSRRQGRRPVGGDNVLFRRNSVSGAVEAVPWKGKGIALNAALHAN